MHVRYCPGLFYDTAREELVIQPRALARHLDGHAPVLTVRELADVFADSLLLELPLDEPQAVAEQEGDTD